MTLFRLHVKLKYTLIPEASWKFWSTRDSIMIPRLVISEMYPRLTRLLSLDVGYL